jgi:hypothetical protein
MNLAMEYAEGNGVINPTIDLAGIGILPEDESKPRFVFTPDGSDKLCIEKVRPIVDALGSFREETIQKYNVSYERRIELFGEEFFISREGDQISIFNCSWPFSGHGSSPSEAISDVRSTIRHLKDHYAHASIDSLDGRAVLFRDYIFSLNA